MFDRATYNREYVRNRRATDPEFLSRERERAKLAARRRRAANPEKVRAYIKALQSTPEAKARRAERHQERMATDVQFANKYRENKRLRQRRRYREARWLNILSAARVRAKKKHLEYSLTKEWASSRWTGKCELTGIQFYEGLSEAHELSPSIDRIDNSLGYIPGNCRFILWGVNRFKGEGTDAEMLRLAKIIVASMDGALC